MREKQQRTVTRPVKASVCRGFGVVHLKVGQTIELVRPHPSRIKDMWVVRQLGVNDSRGLGMSRKKLVERTEVVDG